MVQICLSFDQLQTVLTEVEAMLNSRPLVNVGANLNSGLTITTSHFLDLNPKTSNRGTTGRPRLSGLDEFLQETAGNMAQGTETS